jgi:sulfatase maturation enzyme AslB (radical SAM superfamily)
MDNPAQNDAPRVHCPYYGQYRDNFLSDSVAPTCRESYRALGSILSGHDPDFHGSRSRKYDWTHGHLLASLGNPVTNNYFYPSVWFVVQYAFYPMALLRPRLAVDSYLSCNTNCFYCFSVFTYITHQSSVMHMKVCLFVALKVLDFLG